LAGGVAKTALDLLAGDEARSKRAGLETRGVGLNHPDIASVLGVATFSGASVTDKTAPTVPTFYACARLLSDMVGMLPVKCYRRTGDGREEAIDAPVNALVSRSPSPAFTAFQTRKQAQEGVIYGGNGYLRVWRNRYMEPEEMQWIAPATVKPMRMETPDGRVRIQYEVTQTGGRNVLLQPWDLVHIRHHSADGIMGRSVVSLLRETVGTQMAQRDFAASVMKNGARFPGVLKAPPATTPEKMKEAARQWRQVHEGPEHAGKTPVLMPGWEWLANNGMSLADQEFLESRKFERSEIATAFGIPEVLLGNSEKTSSWGTGIETLINGFLSTSLNPWLVNWEQALDHALLSEAQKDQGYYFRFNRRALLQVALEAQAKFFREMRDIGVYSVNDIRALLEENDIEGGDDYAKPFNGSGGTPSPAPAAAQPGDN
jgi:HK97 family phage portal protein